MLKSILVVLLLTFPALAQTAYRDDALGFTMTIPQGWVQRPQEDVDALNEETASRKPDRNFYYTAAFAAEPDSDQSPYIIIQFTRIPLDGASYSDLEKAFNASTWKKTSQTEVKKLAGDLVKSANLTTPQLDRENNRVMFDLSLTSADGIALRGRSVMHLVSNGGIQINFYSPSSSFEQNLPQLEPFIAGFQLDPGREFVPRSGMAWSSLTTKIAIGAAIGLICGLFHWLRSRAKSAA